ncbi:hypothetical protein Tco_0152863 [Tanacetum coccineum]
MLILTITYTSVYTDSKPGRVFWGADKEISNGGPPRVIVYGSMTSLCSVSEPIYPEYIPLEDEHVFLVEKQPLPHVDSPTAESPGYVTESDPEEDPEEYEDDKTEDGLVDYPIRGGACCVFIPPPFTKFLTGARDHCPDSGFHIPLETEVERLLAMPIPSPSPPISLSPPFARERLARCTAPSPHSSPPPVPLPLLPSSECPTQIQALRIASTQALVDVVTAALPSPLLLLDLTKECHNELTSGEIGTHQELQTYRDHVYAHETHIQAHQAQLQLQSTLIQTQHQVYETRFQMQQAEMAELRETDRRRQAQMAETLRVMRDMRREMSDMQAELLAHREQQRRARQPGPDARIPDHQDASGDADSHI